MIDAAQTWMIEAWNASRATPNLTVIADMIIALILGFLFGYERSYHGRAAGMRTYGLVCMVSSVLVSVSVHPGFWLQGHSTVNINIVDATRTIQGLVTGIGFLGAGIIMQNGLKISGLTTAASIWAAAAIGILVGLGFHIPAIVMTVLAELFVMMGSRFDVFMPSRRPISITLQFKKGIHPNQQMIQEILQQCGYELAKGTITIQAHNEQVEWRFVAVSINKRRDTLISEIADSLPKVEGIDNFHLSRARN